VTLEILITELAEISQQLKGVNTNALFTQREVTLWSSTKRIKFKNFYLPLQAKDSRARSDEESTIFLENIFYKQLFKKIFF
jgi:hypothetical protein